MVCGSLPDASQHVSRLRDLAYYDRAEPDAKPFPAFDSATQVRQSMLLENACQIVFLPRKDMALQALIVRPKARKRDTANATMRCTKVNLPVACCPHECGFAPFPPELLGAARTK